MNIPFNNQAVTMKNHINVVATNNQTDVSSFGAKKNIMEILNNFSPIKVFEVMFKSTNRNMKLEPGDEMKNSNW